LARAVTEHRGEGGEKRAERRRRSQPAQQE
jgi:hypothetical protein